MVQFTGRITKDAIVKTINGGKSVVDFSIAINDFFKRRDGESVNAVLYVNCSYWVNPEKVGPIIKREKSWKFSAGCLSAPTATAKANPPAV